MSRAPSFGWTLGSFAGLGLVRVGGVPPRNQSDNKYGCPRRPGGSVFQPRAGVTRTRMRSTSVAFLISPERVGGCCELALPASLISVVSHMLSGRVAYVSIYTQQLTMSLMSLQGERLLSVLYPVV